MADKIKTGHRQRLRNLFQSGDEESRSDEGLLELLLTYAIGRKDVQPIVEELLRVFGNLDEIFDASADDLKKIKGLGQKSITLLKVVNFINNRKIPVETVPPLTSVRDDRQMQIFQEPPNASVAERSSQNSMTSKTLQIKTQAESEGKSLKKRQNSSEHDEGRQESKTNPTTQTPKKPSQNKKDISRKLQVSNSYLLEFDQLARVLNFLIEQKETKRITRKKLKDNNGLAERQIGSLVSMGTAMGLIKPKVQMNNKRCSITCRQAFV